MKIMSQQHLQQVANKLLQMANAAVYDENRKVIEIHDLKIEALLEVLEVNDNKPTIVLYNYQHDLDRLKQGLVGSTSES